MAESKWHDTAMDRDVVAAARGSHEAFGRLVQATQGMVTGIALAVVGDPAASQDIAQETYLAVWKKLSTLSNPAAFLPWLRTIARNRSRNHLASRKRREERTSRPSEMDAFADTSPSPDQQLESDEQGRLFRRALDELPVDSREILILYYREGQSTRQVSRLLDLSEAAVRQRLTRARQRLRSEWEDRVRDVVRQSSPGNALGIAVLSAITAGSPAMGKVVAAKAVAKAGAHALGWKTIGLFFSAMVIPALVGIATAVLGIRVEMKRTDSDVERRGLRHVCFASILLILATVGLIAAGAVLDQDWMAIAGYLALCLGLGILYLVWLPSIVRPRWEREVAQNPERVIAWRREMRGRWIGYLCGILSGGIGLAAGLWLG